MTTPVFILNAGRSGSEAIVKALRCFDETEVEAHHEYMVHHIQPLACKWAMMKVEPEQVSNGLDHLLGASIQLSDSRLWVDSCNKLSWLTNDLACLFWDALFIHLTRDGRRVVASYYHKLSQECYNPPDVLVLRNWMEGFGIKPPPEKRYWWPLPAQELDQFGNICWHWAANNQAVLDGLVYVPAARHLSLRLEDLTVNRAELNRLLNFLDLPTDGPQADSAWASLARPTNAREPISYPLTDQQLITFNDLCGGMMERLGYTGPDYEVAYVNEDRPPKGRIYDY